VIQTYSKEYVERLEAVYEAADELLTAMWDAGDVSVAEDALESAISAVQTTREPHNGFCPGCEKCDPDWFAVEQGQERNLYEELKEGLEEIRDKDDG